jgi:hypothetical protein
VIRESELDSLSDTSPKSSERPLSGRCGWSLARNGRRRYDRSDPPPVVLGSPRILARPDSLRWVVYHGSCGDAKATGDYCW